MVSGNLTKIPHTRLHYILQQPGVFLACASEVHGLLLLGAVQVAANT